MNEANKVKLGAFLLISITLLITAFLAAGISQIFSPKFHAVTILNTSVEGLAVGSPVKYLGMPIGKITRMAMRENDGCVAVYFDIFPAAVETEDSDDDTGTVADIANIMHRKNLMCFINAAGIMGGTYLELSINESSQPGAAPSGIQAAARRQLHSVASVAHRQRDPEHQPDAGRAGKGQLHPARRQAEPDPRQYERHPEPERAAQHPQKREQHLVDAGEHGAAGCRRCSPTPTWKS